MVASKTLIKKFGLTGLVAVALQIAVPHAVGSAPHAAMEQVIVTATREETALKELAGNTAIINQTELRLIAQVHIQESLARVAGANLARGNGQEYLPALRSPVLTGAGGCGGLLTAVDGVPLRSSGFCNINELFEVNSEQAERIEVVRGPGSALYGSNAMHGVVNIITPRVGEHSGFNLGFDGGPHGYARSKMSVTHLSGEHGIRADMVVGHDGGYRDDSGYDQQKLTLRHEFNRDPLAITSTLAFSNLNQETAGYITGKDAYKDDQLKDTNPNPEAYRDAKSVRWASRIDYRVDENQRFSVTPYARYTDMDFLQHFLPGDPLEQNGQTSVGVQSTYYREINDRWQLITGLDLEYTDATLEQAQDQPTQGSAFLQNTIPVGKHYDYQVAAHMAAPYIQSRWTLTEALDISIGLRYEVMNYDYDNRMLDGRTADDGTACGFGGCRYSRPADRDDRFENWSPKLAMLYRLNDTHQVYVNLSKGFRAPQATELYRLQRNQQVANLHSEELTSTELGLRGDNGRTRYDIALYAMEKDNVIFRDSDFFNLSDGETKHHGVEVSVDHMLAKNWTVGLAASYAHHEYTSDQIVSGVNIKGNEIDTAPKKFGSLHLGWKPTDMAHAELEWLHLGEYFTDPENRHRYDGHNVFNLRARWQLDQKKTVSARITNLTNVEYAERADYTSFSGDRYFPGEPRAVYVGFEIAW